MRTNDAATGKQKQDGMNHQGARSSEASDS
jgi:hypothetical protein